MGIVSSQFDYRERTDQEKLRKAYEKLAESVSIGDISSLFSADDQEMTDGAVRACIRYSGGEPGIVSDEETDRITLLYPVSKNHAYEYALWDEIIGYEVIRENVEEFGLVPFVSEIIYKMTYFGFDEEELAEIREAVSITMSELDKARELPDEEREKVVFSAERSAAYFSFQDNRPFEEKERERIEDCKNAIKDKIIEFRTVMRYIDEI